MLRIRLKRCGRKKLPSYRIVLVPSQSRRDGRALEEFGYYNPITKELKYKKESIVKRLEEGAKASQTVINLLIKTGLLDQKGKMFK